MPFVSGGSVAVQSEDEGKAAAGVARAGDPDEDGRMSSDCDAVIGHVILRLRTYHHFLPWINKPPSTSGSV